MFSGNGNGQKDKGNKMMKRAGMYDKLVFFALLVLVLAAFFVAGFVWNAARNLTTPENVILWILLATSLLWYWLFSTGGLSVRARGADRVVFNMRYVVPNEALRKKVSSERMAQAYRGSAPGKNGDEETTQAIRKQMCKHWPIFLFEASWFVWIAFAVYSWFGMWDRVTGGGVAADTALISLNEPPFESDNVGSPPGVFVAANAMWLVFFTLMVLWRFLLLDSKHSKNNWAFRVLISAVLLLAFGAVLAALILSAGVWYTSFGLAFVPAGITLAYVIFFTLVVDILGYALGYGNFGDYSREMNYVHRAMAMYWQCEYRDEQDASREAAALSAGNGGQRGEGEEESMMSLF